MASIEPHPTRQSRRVKKLSLVVLGLLGFVIALVAIGPMFVDWKRFAPRITQAVRDATRLELRIDGDVRVRLLPAIEVGADAVRVLNPPGFQSSHLASVKRIHGRVRLWPLLVRQRVDVEQLSVEQLVLALEVNENGDANWNWTAESEADPAQRETSEATSKEKDQPEIWDWRLREFRLSDSVLSFENAENGHSLVGREWEMATSTVSLKDPFELRTSLLLNDEQVSLHASAQPLQALLARHPGRLGLRVWSKHVEVKLDTMVRQESFLELDGTASIDVPSAGALATWLDAPLDTDPGPIALRAELERDSAKAARGELSIEGDYLDMRGSVSVDLKDDVTRFVAKLEGEGLELDRYVPPKLLTVWAERNTPPFMDQVSEALEMPLDLGAPQRLTAEVDIDLAGIGLAGYAVGPIRLQARAKDGHLDAKLGEVGLYDGTFSGRLSLAAGAESVAVEASFEAKNIDAGAIASVAAPGAPPVVGTASGHLEVQTQGGTMRELVTNTAGLLRADLASEVGVGRVGQLSHLSLTLRRPAGDNTRLSLLGDAVYGGESIVFDITTDPLRTMLAKAPVAVEAELRSEVLEASYRGRVLQMPVFSLDGEFDTKLGSVARFARWLGRPLPSSKPDPGVLEAHAVFVSNGRSGTVEEATLRAGGLSVEAGGDFEAIGDQVRFSLVVESGVLDLDRFMPARPRSIPEASPPKSSDSVLTLFSDKPFDTAWLDKYQGRVDVNLQGLGISGLQTGSVRAVGTVDDGVFKVRLDEFVLREFLLSAELRVDGTGQDLQAQASARLENLKTSALEDLLDAAVYIDGEASAALNLTTRGNSPRRLVASATGELAMKLPSARFYKGPFARAFNIEANAALGGVEEGPRVQVSGELEARKTGAEYPFEVKSQIGPLPKLIIEKALPLQLRAKVGQNDLYLNGSITGLDASPSTQLDIELSAPRLSGLGADTGDRLMDVGPVSVAAMLQSGPGVYRFNGLNAKVGKTDIAGTVMLAVDGERPRVSAVLRSNVVDLWELLPYRLRETAEQPPASNGSSYQIPDKPLPLSELQSIDADLQVSVAKLRTGIDTRVDDIEARVRLSEGRLEVAPITGGFAGGSTYLRLVLDASEEPARFDAQFAQRQMLLGTFLPVLQSSGDSVGRVDLDLQISGVGNTPRAIASSLDGHVAVAGAGGAIERAMLRLFVIGLSDILRPFYNRQGNTYINCIVVGLDFESGFGTMQTFLLDMPALSIGGSGTVDLRDETLALRFSTRSKYASLASLAGPFDVTGTLGAPRARANTVGTVLSAATSPLTTAFGVLGRILPGGQNACEIAIGELQQMRDDAAETSAETRKGETADLIQTTPHRARPSRRN